MSNQQLATEFKNKGNQAFKAKNYPQAIEHFTKAIELNPNDHVFFSNRSGAYLNNKQLDLALQDAEACVKINPTWPRGYQRKGTALFYLDQFEQAINAYKQGLKHDPNNAELLKNIKDAESKKEGQMNNMNNMMQVYMKLMNDPEAKGLLSDPTFFPILQAIMSNPAEASKHMGDPRVQKIMKILQAKTSNDDLDRMKNMFQKQNFSEAKSQSKPEQKQEKHQESHYTAPPPPPPKKEEKKPEKMDVEDPAEELKNKGNEEFKKKNFNEALNYYEQAIDANPNQPLYYNNKAAAYIELHQLDSALEEIARAQKLFEQGVSKDFVKKGKVLARKGTILAKQDKIDQAITALERSLLEDSNPKAKDQLNRYKKIKKQRQAKAYINPELAEQHNEQGSNLYKQGKFPQALKEYQEAVRRNPDNPKFYSNIGQVYIKLMEFQQAKSNYQQALKRDPTFQKAYHKKGDCHFFLKEYHKALETYEAGLKRDQEDHFCKEGIEKTKTAIYMGSNEEDQQERAKRAMADPQIQAILQTPEVRNALSEMERDPKSLQNILKDKNIAQKIQKLVAAGVLRMG